MKRVSTNRLVVVAYSALLIALLSAFTTIVSYTNRLGVRKSFSIVDFISDPYGFGSFVFREYTGVKVVTFASWQLFILIVLGAAALLCAFLGLVKLSRQTDNKISFILTIIGLVGTMAPSIVLFISIILLKDKYLGTISCGIYPVAAPIAMIFCIAASTKMRRKNNEYRKRLKEAEGLIFRGGDLK